MCDKRCYPDKKAAKSAINRVARKRGRGNRAEWLRAYFCEVCQAWHLTKQEKREEL